LEAGRDGIPQLNRRYAFILGGSVLEGVISENVTVELLMKYEEVKKKGKYVSGLFSSDLRISSMVTRFWGSRLTR
jgi:hypothetical protein